MAAALRAVGELGYGNVGIDDVIQRSGEPEGEFHRHFGSVEECFAVAYAGEAERLVGRLLEAGAAQPSWRLGLRAALKELSAYVVENPHRTRALLIDVHLAGAPAIDRRAELTERLTAAIDRGRGEGPGSSEDSPPPLTAPFMVGAIEAAIVSALVNGKPEAFVRAVPELEQLIADAYLQPHS